MPLATPVAARIGPAARPCRRRRRSRKTASLAAALSGNFQPRLRRINIVFVPLARARCGRPAGTRQVTLLLRPLWGYDPHPASGSALSHPLPQCGRGAFRDLLRGFLAVSGDDLLGLAPAQLLHM